MDMYTDMDTDMDTDIAAGLSYDYQLSACEVLGIHRFLVCFPSSFIATNVTQDLVTKDG